MRPGARRCAPVLLFALIGAPAAAAPDAGTDAGADRSTADPTGRARDGAADGRDGGDAGVRAGGDAGEVSPPRAAAEDSSATAPGPLGVTLRGRVVERGSKRPLAGASIKVDAVPIATTDGEGRFELSVAPGRHRLEIQLAGQATLDARIDARADLPEQTFRMTPGLTGDHHETVVHAGRPELAKITLSGDEARQTAGTSGDPMRVIGALPGVIQIAWPAALYVVRGANPGNTGFFLDGIRVPALFHLALGPSVIHPYLIDGVDFYPGGYPANYGPYVSGIMTARTAAPPADRVHASVDVTFFDAGGIVTSPWDGGRGTVAVAGRYSYTGEIFGSCSTYPSGIIAAAGDGLGNIWEPANNFFPGWEQGLFSFFGGATGSFFTANGYICKQTGAGCVSSNNVTPNTDISTTTSPLVTQSLKQGVPAWSFDGTMLEGQPQSFIGRQLLDVYPLSP